MSEHIPLTIAAVFLTAMACQWLAWRVKLPAIIFLLLAAWKTFAPPIGEN